VTATVLNILLARWSARRHGQEFIEARNKSTEKPDTRICADELSFQMLRIIAVVVYRDALQLRRVRAFRRRDRLPGQGNDGRDFTPAQTLADDLAGDKSQMHQ
jgi:hypothetical protein